MNKRALKAEPKPTQGMRPSHLMVVFDEPIVAQRWAVKATGSLPAAVMISYALQLSQALQNQNDGWFAKTMGEWQEEAGLSRSEQETARATRPPTAPSPIWILQRVWQMKLQHL